MQTKPTPAADAPHWGDHATVTPVNRSNAVGIQEALVDPDRSALAKYQDLVVGRPGLVRLVLYEAVVTLAAWVPGALGLLLRRLAFPWILARVGQGVVFGQGVVLRHPHKIRLGAGVIIDDLVVLDAKGTSNQGIEIGDGAFIGRGTILSCKNGDIVLEDRVNLGFYCEIFSGSRVRVGRQSLFAAHAYLIGGGHEYSESAVPILEQERSSQGIELGENVWLGAGVKVLDGVRIGRDVVVGANAVVNADLPDGVVAAGVPARILRRRGREGDSLLV